MVDKWREAWGRKDWRVWARKRMEDTTALGKYSCIVDCIVGSAGWFVLVADKVGTNNRCLSMLHYYYEFYRTIAILLGTWEYSHVIIGTWVYMREYVSKWYVYFY